jgi:hypothetical protein
LQMVIDVIVTPNHLYKFDISVIPGW